MCLTIYDAATDERREATQADLDWYVNVFHAMQHANHAIDEQRVWPREDEMKFKLAVFPNRMRDDLVFVAQDLPIEPYEGITDISGYKCYPSVPQRGIKINSGLPYAFARELVRRWNLMA